MPQRFEFLVDGETYFECDLGCVKCKGSTVIGMPCKRMSCIGTPYCWSHLRSMKHLRIKPSRIKGAGKGLFVDHAEFPPGRVIFKKGDIIIKYDGEVVSTQQMNSRYGKYTAPYGARISGRQKEDGACRRGVGTLANHMPSRTNARLVTYKGRVKLQAVEDIKNGDEIYLDYGEDYDFAEPTSSRTVRTRQSKPRVYRHRRATSRSRSRSRSPSR